MADFKGFGTPPAEPIATLITIEDGTREEMDRAMHGYLRQGLSQQRVLHCVAASVMFLAAREAGMIEGVDYTWMDGESSMSPRMAEWVKSTMPEQHWNHMEMEGFITKVQSNPEPEVALTPMGFAKLVLLNAKDPEESGVDSKKAQRACLDLLESIGLSVSDAEGRLQRYLNGDESLEELLELIEERVAVLRDEEGEASSND
jgi:hypothetical protein